MSRIDNASLNLTFNANQKVNDRVLWYASHVYTVNEDGNYTAVKSRQEESTSYNHDELMARVTELTGS